MRELLEKHYGPGGCHITALEDVYLNRTTAKAIGLCMPIGDEIPSSFEEHHQKAAWKTISDSLSNTYTQGGKSIAELSWKTVVQSNLSIPVILDELASRLKLAGIATGKALQGIVTWVYNNIQKVWNYIKSFFGKEEVSAVDQSQQETETFFSTMSRYINTEYFENIAHKVLSGIWIIVENIRSFLYQVSGKMTEFLYGAMESIYKSTADGLVVAKRAIVKMGFYIISFVNNIGKFADSRSAMVEKMLIGFGEQIKKFVSQIVRFLSETAVTLLGWMFDAVKTTVQWIIQYLPWLSSLISSLGSTTLSLFGTLNTLAPLFQNMFGTFFTSMIEQFKNSDQRTTNGADKLQEVKKQAEDLKNDPDVSSDMKELLEQSISITTLVQLDLDEGQKRWKDKLYENATELNEDSAEFFTQAFEQVNGGKDTEGYVFTEERSKIDAALFSKVVQSRTGYEPSQLAIYLSTVQEFNNTVLLSAQLSKLPKDNLSELIGGLLSPDEEDELSFLLDKQKGGNALSTNELDRARYLTRKKDDLNDIFDMFKGSFTEDLNAEEDIIRKNYALKGIEEIETMMAQFEDSIIQQLRAILEHEKKHKIVRDDEVQNALLTYLQLDAEAKKTGQQLTVINAIDAGLSRNAFAAIADNLESQDYVPLWAKLYATVNRYNILRSAVNLKKKELILKKADWTIITAVAALLFDVGIYILILYLVTNPKTGFVDTAQVSEQVIDKGVFWNTVKTVTKTVTGISAPAAADALDYRNIYGYVEEAFSSFSFMHFPKYITLISMVWNLVPAANAIFLFTWFAMTTIVFLKLERNTPNYHTEGFYMMNAGKKLVGSLAKTFGIVMWQVFIVWQMGQLSSMENYMAYGNILLGIAGGVSYLNPLSILSSLQKGATDVIQLQKKKFDDAMNTRWNPKDFLLSRRVRNQLMPIDLKKESSKLQMLTFLEVASITDLSAFGNNIVTKQTNVLETMGRERTNAEEKELKKLGKSKKQKKKKKGQTNLLDVPPKEKEEEEGSNFLDGPPLGGGNPKLQWIDSDDEDEI